MTRYIFWRGRISIFINIDKNATQIIQRWDISTMSFWLSYSHHIVFRIIVRPQTAQTWCRKPQQSSKAVRPGPRQGFSLILLPAFCTIAIGLEIKLSDVILEKNLETSQTWCRKLQCSGTQAGLWGPHPGRGFSYNLFGFRIFSTIATQVNWFGKVFKIRILTSLFV